MARVSVLVPCYNYAHFLPGCLESILSQEGVDVEVLVIDDASTDSTSQVAASIAGRDPRVTVRRHETNIGHIATYNEGLERVAGDYTLLISADDRLVPGGLLRATRVMDANPKVGFVYGRAVVFRTDDSMPAPRTPVDFRHEVRSGREWLAMVCREGENPTASPEVLVRTSLQRDVGGYRPELPLSGDLEMWMRFAARSDVGVILDADQAYYRVHPKGLQRTRFQSPLVRQEQRRLAFDLFFREEGRRLPEAERLRETAMRSVAREALRAASLAFDRGELDGVGVEELIEFAVSAYPDARSLREHSALAWRIRLGPARTARLRPVLDVALLRRPRAWVRAHTWR